MKKRIIGAVALLAGAFIAHSQGIITFANYAALPTYVYVSLSSGRLSPPYPPPTLLGGSSTGTTGIPYQDTSNGNDWTVALYGNAGWNDPANSLVQLYTSGSSPNAGTPVTTTLENGNFLVDVTAGTWYWPYSPAVVPGTSFAGQPVTVQIYAWYNDGGRVTSYAAAQADAFPTGFSSTANMLTGGPNFEGPPSVPTTLPTFQIGGGDIQIRTGLAVPEPNTIVLGVLGASAFFLRFLGTTRSPARD